MIASTKACLRFLASMLAVSASISNAALEPPVLRLSIETEPLTLDWNESSTESDRFVISFLMRGLLKIDASSKPVCDLCNKFSTDAAGQTLTFELGDWSWSDGVKLEARHFVDSFERLMGPANRARMPEEFKLVSSVRAEAPGKLVLKLSKRVSTLPYLLTTVATFPIRKDLAIGAGGEKHAQTAVLGPYILAEWAHGKRIVLEGNPTFRGPRPVYRVELILGDRQAQLAKLRSGRLDILSRPTTTEAMKFPGQKIQVSPFWATRMLLLNHARAPISERNFRRAILHSLDRDAIPAQLGSGERRATGLIPPGVLGHRQASLVAADLPLANQELEAAMAGAKPAPLKLLARDTETDRKLATWLKTMLSRIKLELSPSFLSPQEYSKNLGAGEFDLALQVFGFETSDPAEILRAFRTAGPRNPGKWTHVGFDGLLSGIREAATSEEAAGLVEKATQIFEAQEVAAIPLGYPAQSFLLSSRVSSFATTPFGDPDLLRIQLKR